MPRACRLSSTRLRMVAEGQAGVLHGEGQLVLDHLGHELGFGVLEDQADGVAHLAGPTAMGSRPATVTLPDSSPP